MREPVANDAQPRDRRQAYGQVILLCWGVFGFFNTPVTAWLFSSGKFGAVFSGLHRLGYGRAAFANTLSSVVVFDWPSRNVFVLIPISVSILVARSIWLGDFRMARWSGYLAVGSVAASLPFQIPFGTLNPSRWFTFGLVSVITLLLPVLGLGLVMSPERFGDLFLGTAEDGVINRGPMTSMHTLAIASLALAILGGALFAAVPGHIALRRIDRSRGQEAGRGPRWLASC